MQTLVIKREPTTLWVHMHRPKERNAFNPQLIDELTQTFEVVDAGVRCIVLKGEGPAFSAGADLGWMRQSATLSQEQNVVDAQKLVRLFDAINNAPAVVIGWVNGLALGGGAGIVACCDIAVAHEDARFGFTEVRLGLLPAVIAPYVVDKIGLSFARRYFVTGELFDAQAAHRMGLVHTVVSQNGAQQAVLDLIAQVKAAAPDAIAAAKGLLRALPSLQGAALRQTTTATIARVRVGAEAQAGLGAFFEKQPPPWAKEPA